MVPLPAADGPSTAMIMFVFRSLIPLAWSGMQKSGTGFLRKCHDKQKS
jgi:hypothetical protein